ncbi:hypothetical protein H1P_1930004 [Hyella patelloides LEGE 07179]|uniref:NYN domain-containing protein n=1 Tax=Hyella patelloides LEGE 07179 TaxID=945734 RepID=A0A563VPF8_9CYAN|nr:NYN domain-containing protein [Hyella patelloides]VEP13303.1 hypothetical protein H1P_1930004 [Hyella patelloides LEGE 07179]
MQQSESKIALLIDADNAPASKIEAIVSEIAKYGVANIRKAYGNWKSPGLKAWEECLHEYAIRPVQQFDYTKGKNATDAAMIIDAMDLLYTQQLDAFAIVSSDCDFTPLVMRILTNGLKVYGFGEKKTPLPFVYACSTFNRDLLIFSPWRCASTSITSLIWRSADSSTARSLGNSSSISIISKKISLPGLATAKQTTFMPLAIASSNQYLIESD